MKISDNNKRRLWLIFFASIFMYAALAYGLFGQLIANKQMFAFEIDGHPFISDFANTYNAGVLADHCLTTPTMIYDRDVQDKSQRQFIAPIVPEQPFYCQYPPYFFALTLPLAKFDITRAWFVWCGVAALLMVLVTPRLLMHNERYFLSRKRKFLVLALMFSTFPAWYSFKLGQPVLYTYIALAFMASRLFDGRGILAGMACLIVFVKLQYAPVLTIVGLVWGRARFLLGAVIAAVILLALSCLILGVENVMAYPQILLAAETGRAVSGVASDVMQNIRGQLVQIFGVASPLVRWGTIGGFLLSLPLTLVLWLKYSGTADRDHSVPLDRKYQLLFSYTILLMLATSLHTHYQDYLLATIPCIWIWTNFENRNDKSLRVKALLCLAIGFVPLSWLGYVVSTTMALKVQPFLLWNIIVQALLLPEIISPRAIPED